ncbi:MAG: NAD(P)/FAD-dependent oxidoreductase [Opitutae bacterium]|nr:NAD(P)/FAD-dependent oxidoreductase [Opitutae bacterium]
MPATLDAVIVGSGPNGLTAAAVLARAGWSVRVIEAADEIGGGCRTATLTLPGFVHDVCAAVHPTAQLSPAFRELDLAAHGVEWVSGPVALAHPLPGGDAALLFNSLEETAHALDEDGAAWRSLMEPLLDDRLLDSLLRPQWQGLTDAALPKMQFGLAALRSAEGYACAKFRSARARALFAGCSAHSSLPLSARGSASFGLVLALAAHRVGWPIARGGSARIVEALARIIRSHGGTVETGQRVRLLRELPASRVVLFDVNPAQVAAIAAGELPRRYAERLRRFRHGPGVCKVDWALSAPIPWRAAACARAGTVHVGGTLEEIARSERAVADGCVSDAPFVLAGQPTAWDATRAPAGQHVAWAYCHVPNGCTLDLTERIEAQIERFASGFRDVILARHTMSAPALEAHNAAMIGGDIGGGANDLLNFLFRPSIRWNPYATPNSRLFICSSSTPPGGGVHGMCGYLAARAVLRRHGDRAARASSLVL